jgi:molybdopterin converting factor small subunit
MITVEFYGVPRLRAGVNRVQLEAATVGEALRALARSFPALADLVAPSASLHASCRLNLNGNRFVDDAATPLSAGDALLLMSADVGG